MPIPGNILKQIKCCLYDDGHIVNEPVVLKCGANACKKCVSDSIDGNMFIKERPEMIVVVSRFSGYASIDDYMKHRDLIVQALGPDEAKEYDTVNLLTAGYDAPFKPIFRRNILVEMKFGYVKFSNFMCFSKIF